MEGTKQKIKHDIDDRLCSDCRVDGADIEIEVLDGTVILTGTVNSHFAKLSASELAWGCSRVWSVDNRIKVKYPQDGVPLLQWDQAQHGTMR